MFVERAAILLLLSAIVSPQLRADENYVIGCWVYVGTAHCGTDNSPPCKCGDAPCELIDCNGDNKWVCTCGLGQGIEKLVYFDIPLWTSAPTGYYANAEYRVCAVVYDCHAAATQETVCDDQCNDIQRTCGWEFDRFSVVQVIVGTLSVCPQPPP